MIAFLVIGARLLVPLFIPKFPLPASIAAIVSDFVDGKTQEAFASVGLTDYQGYDKALDVYYLSIQYLSTMRNWENLFAFQVGRLLFYYRLIGGLLFELLQIRAIFLFFPNTFEYFFLFYEAVRLRWNPRRLTPALLLGATLIIWVFIKIPQEYWIHIAQLGVPDVKQYILRVPVNASWSTIVAERAGFFVALAAVIVVTIAAIRRYIERDLPPADWPLSFDADAHGRDDFAEDELAVRAAGARRLIDAELGEKIVLVSIVTILFARMLPAFNAELAPTAIGIAIVVVATTAVSEWMERRGVRWQAMPLQFVVIALTNGGIAAVFWLILPLLGGQLELGTALFLLLQLSLLVTLYDRYRPISLARQFRIQATGQA